MMNDPLLSIALAAYADSVNSWPKQAPAWKVDPAFLPEKYTVHHTHGMKAAIAAYLRADQRPS